MHSSDGLERLDRATCLRLLGQSALGRLAVSTGALPHIEPAHFCLDGDELLILLRRYDGIDVAVIDNVVAFEVDTFDSVRGSGWSVVVTGLARRVDGPRARQASERLDAEPWSSPSESVVIGLPTVMMSGRRAGARSRIERPAVDRDGGAAVLDLDECWRLLRSDDVGRIAVVHGDAPFVVPINYVVDGATIVFRSDPGTKLHSGMRAKVCLEIDGLDRAARAGWSVLVMGRLEELTAYDGRELERVDQLAGRPWAGGRKQRIVRLVPSSITGRSVGRLPAAAT